MKKTNCEQCKKYNRNQDEHYKWYSEEYDSNNVLRDIIMFIIILSMGISLTLIGTIGKIKMENKELKKEICEIQNMTVIGKTENNTIKCISIKEMKEIKIK